MKKIVLKVKNKRTKQNTLIVAKIDNNKEVSGFVAGTKLLKDNRIGLFCIPLNTEKFNRIKKELKK